jgi:hypothetical protein
MSIDKITRKANTSIPIEDENKKTILLEGFYIGQKPKT